jgi:hypothetical protein
VKTIQKVISQSQRLTAAAQLDRDEPDKDKPKKAWW